MCFFVLKFSRCQKITERATAASEDGISGAQIHQGFRVEESQSKAVLFCKADCAVRWAKTAMHSMF